MNQPIDEDVEVIEALQQIERGERTSGSLIVAVTGPRSLSNPGRGAQPVGEQSLPHDVIASVTPRTWMGVPFTLEWRYEADLTVEVTHPSQCPATVVGCPVAEVMESDGLSTDFTDGFGEVGDLSDDQLVALDGTVRSLVVTRSTYGYSDPTHGHGLDVEFTFTWIDR